MPPTDTATAEWGKRYRTERLARGWTQRQLAKESGVPQPVISRVETSGGASVRTHLALASALGLRLDTFLSQQREDVA